MKDCIRFSSRASLIVTGLRIRQMGVWEMIGERVMIRQKVIRYTPLEKLMDAFINIMAGGHGLVETNTRVRTDQALSAAFGRNGCAEQSTVSDTLNACTEENVEQMREALREIYRRYGAGYRHPYGKAWQLLDVDMTGMPAGRQGEGVEKGYFAKQKNRRGRQLGRVVATRYDEIVAERLFDGKTQLNRALQPLVRDAEDVLGLEPGLRQRSIMRVDAGGGRDEDVNWLLNRGYQLLVKVRHPARAAKLCRSVTLWHPDPKIAHRQVGWIEAPHLYDQPTRQLGIRAQKKNGQWSYHVLVFNLTDEALFWLNKDNQAADRPLFAALYAYDLRSGAAETTIKGSKQGLALTKRNKKSLNAQEMLVLLTQLAYNLIGWTRNTLAAQRPAFSNWGPLRMVRDAFHIKGRIEFNEHGHISRITLQESHTLADIYCKTYSNFLARDGTTVILGQI